MSKNDTGMLNLAKKIFGTQNDRHLKIYHQKLALINDLENKYSVMSDDELKLSSIELKEKTSKAVKVDVLQIYAFALCREMSKRVLKMRHYDVQVIGGLVLYAGNIAEMKTGEGKTLVATLPVYLSALLGNQAHVITVNDYLAKRDALLMKPLYESLGLTIGYLQSDMRDDQRAKQYACDIVYGTNSEFAFDFLRRNIAPDIDAQVQKKCSFALIDEVDSILIDEARTPLVISGHGEVKADEVSVMREIISDFSTEYYKEEKNKELSDVKKDIALMEKTKTAQLTESGYLKLESMLVEKGLIDKAENLYDTRKVYLVKSLETMARAIHLFKCGVDYLVADNKIKIINASTGRVEEGRRWQEGLHQAMEAKESVKIRPDNTVVASISLQNFFRQYSHMCGMTGTANTEAAEFESIYSMNVVIIPSNVPNLRADSEDKVFLTEDGKLKAIIYDLKEIHKTGRPILVGTDSVNESEAIETMLKDEGLNYSILNAKNHEKEAVIIACAGEMNAITISTNMAGRGTDILLGGHENVWASRVDTDDEAIINALKLKCREQREKIKDLGGLHVIGTSRNESRRVDNQLRGRAGRQGDPGSSQFYASFDDRLMSIYGGEGLKGWLKNMGFDNDDMLQHPMINKGLVSAQTKCEGQGSKMRAELLKYDDVINQQRMEMYAVRQSWLEGGKNIDDIHKFIEQTTYNLVDKFIPEKSMYEWDSEGLDLYLKSSWDIEPFVDDLIVKGYFADGIKEVLAEKTIHRFDQALKELNESLSIEMSDEGMSKDLFSRVMIQTIDSYWFEQITLLDDLREGIHLRAYAQKNPLLEFGESSMALFKDMISSIQLSFVADLFGSCYTSIAYYNRQKEEIEKQIEAQIKKSMGDEVSDQLNLENNVI